MPTNLFSALLTTVILLVWYLCLDEKKVPSKGYYVVLGIVLYAWQIALFNTITWFTVIWSIAISAFLSWFLYNYKKTTMMATPQNSLESEFHSVDELRNEIIEFQMEVTNSENDGYYHIIGKTKGGSDILIVSENKPYDGAKYTITHIVDGRIFAKILEN